MFEKCECCEKWDFENVNSTKNEKIEIVNFVKNETFKNWEFCEMWKMRFWKCEFCGKWKFENVNSVKSEVFKVWIFGWIEDFCPSVK